MQLFKTMRATLVAVVKRTPSLPRDLVERTFALYDRSMAESRPVKRAARPQANALAA